MRRRALSIGLSGVLVVGVGAALLLGGRSSDSESDAGGPTVVRGVIGSEKAPFFEDAAVREAFAENGIVVEVESAGSRQIATSVDLGELDFAFPGSGPTAEKIQRDHGITTGYAPFYSPMAIASFESVVDVLATEGVARRDADGSWTFDMAAFMRLAAKDTRWDQLHQDVYPVRKNVLVRTTDPRNSNSAVMYLAITSHVANGDQVVRDQAQEQAVLPEVTPLFMKQGFSAATSGPPFDDYLSQGVGHTPLLFIYEAQFLDRAMEHDGSIVTEGTDANWNMVLLYPSPTVLSNHTLVPLTEKGATVGRLLEEDATLQRLAAEHGFRTRAPAQFEEVVAKNVRDVAVRANVVDVIDPPSYETLERLLTSIEREYRAGGAGSAPDDEESG
jgi:8-oxo-dGTP pyrophosphatase MutT (NUDIX family)